MSQCFTSPNHWGYFISNKYLKVMFKITKKGHLPTPAQGFTSFLYFFHKKFCIAGCVSTSVESCAKRFRTKRQDKLNHRDSRCCLTSKPTYEPNSNIGHIQPTLAWQVRTTSRVRITCMSCIGAPHTSQKAAFHASVTKPPKNQNPRSMDQFKGKSTDFPKDFPIQCGVFF